VQAGVGTNDEMFFDGIMFLKYQPGDELINLEAIMESDSLFSGVKENVKTENKLKAVAFPNPFSSAVSIKYALYENVNVSFEFMDVMGRVISRIYTGKQQEGINSFTWNGKDDKGSDLPGGIYFYRIRAGGETYESKIIKQ
jgi:flagellar hook assembly protein FlgD